MEDAHTLHLRPGMAEEPRCNRHLCDVASASAYESENLHPFFANLLPEGWLLEVSSKRLKISKDDPFGLLLATCQDCIGAVEIEDAENQPVQAA